MDGMAAWCKKNIMAHNDNNIDLIRLKKVVKEIEHRKKIWREDKKEDSIFASEYLRGRVAGLDDALFVIEILFSELKEENND